MSLILQQQVANFQLTFTSSIMKLSQIWVKQTLSWSASFSISLISYFNVSNVYFSALCHAPNLSHCLSNFIDFINFTNVMKLILGRLLLFSTTLNHCYLFPSLFQSWWITRASWHKHGFLVTSFESLFLLLYNGFPHIPGKNCKKVIFKCNSLFSGSSCYKIMISLLLLRFSGIPEKLYFWSFLQYSTLSI